jgi:Xaa-Pro aminopeptidase
MLEKVHEQVTAACGPAGTGHDVHSHLTLLLVRLAQLKGYDLGPGTGYGICNVTGGRMSS